jgi:hypothetical protein
VVQRKAGPAGSKGPPKNARARGTTTADGQQGRAGARGEAGPLTADFAGACSLEIHDSPSPPPGGEYPLRCRVEFSADRETLTLSDFEPIRTAGYAAKVGPLTVTNSTAVHLKSSSRGTLTRDGHVAIDVVLHFDHSFDAPFVEEDSDLPVTLATRDGGTPLDAKGDVTLVGTGRFVGGALDGCRCRLTYRGRVKPMPW